MKRCMVLWLCAAVAAVILFPIKVKAVSPSPECQIQTEEDAWSGVGSATPWETVLCRGMTELSENGEQSIACHLSPGLTLGTVVSVLVNRQAINASLYTIVTAHLEDDRAFVLHLAKGAGQKGDDLEVIFTLRLNDRAVVGEEGNRFWITHTDRTGTVRTGKEALIRTWSCQIFRGIQLPENTEKIHPISGACLCLYSDVNKHDRVAFEKKGLDTYLACSAEQCPHGRHVYVLRTPETGQIKLEGLREQTYYLQETRPPDGILETAEDCEISITENGTVVTGNREVGEKGIELIYTPAYSGREKKPVSLLEIYQKGSRLLAAALTFLVATRRHYLN